MPARREPDRTHTRPPTTASRPYRGPDRRGVARFVVPVAWPTTVLVLLGALALILAPGRHVRVGPTALEEFGAIAATLAFMAGVACLLRWRLDGIARGWWCGWALLVIGAGQLAIQPLHGGTTVSADLATTLLGMVLITRAVVGGRV